MATNLFSRAAAYRKKHPGMSMPEAVKAVSKGSKPAKKKPAHKKAAPRKKKHAAHKKAAHKKKATVGRKPRSAPKKKAAATKAAPRKVKVKIKGGKKGGAQVTIGSMSMSGISHEHSRQARLHNHIKSNGAKCKIKGISKQEKANLQREAKALREQIAASKKLVTVLKRSI